MGFTSILLTVGVPVTIERGEAPVSRHTLAIQQERKDLQIDLTQSKNCSRGKHGGKNGGEMHSDSKQGGDKVSFGILDSANFEWKLFVVDGMIDEKQESANGRELLYLEFGDMMLS